MPKTVSMPFGRTLDYTPVNPERTAYKSGMALVSNVTFREWPNRTSMATTIRMQESRESRQDDWKACIPLTDVEGHAGYAAKTLEELRAIYAPGRGGRWIKKETAK